MKFQKGNPYRFRKTSVSGIAFCEGKAQPVRTVWLIGGKGTLIRRLYQVNRITGWKVEW